MVEFRAVNVNCYEATFKFISGSERACAGSLTCNFTAISKKQAVRDAVRFWENRRKSDPRRFKDLLALGVSLKCIGPIDGDGGLTGFVNRCFFEWQVNFPVRLEEYVKEYQEK